MVKIGKLDMFQQHGIIAKKKHIKKLIQLILLMLLKLMISFLIMFGLLTWKNVKIAGINQKKRLEALGIHPNRWTATNATDKDFIDYYKTISKSKCSRSEIACYKSHVKLWEHLYNTGVEYAIIFEDDIIFPPKVTKDIIINVINDSWGFNIIFLGHCYSHLSSFEDPSSKVGSALCNHGYVITRKAIEKYYQ